MLPTITEVVKIIDDILPWLQIVNEAIAAHDKGEIAFQGRRENLSQANKLSRTYATLLEALNRHRGKGQQKVTVEHVHVHSGGHAVVGVVESPGELPYAIVASHFSAARVPPIFSRRAISGALARPDRWTSRTSSRLVWSRSTYASARSARRDSGTSRK